MLANFLLKDCVFINPSVKSRDELFDFFAKRAFKKGLVESAESFYKGLVDREGQGTTELKPGIAIPHAKLDNVKEIFVMIAVFKKPIKFSTGFGKGVDIIFLIGAPQMDNRYIKVLGSIARLIEKDEFNSLLRDADVIEDIFFALNKFAVRDVQQEEGIQRYLLSLSLNVKFPLKSIMAMFLELGINQPTLTVGENLSVKSNFGFPTFGMSMMDMGGTLSENKTITGITDDKDAPGKLYNLLKEEGIDVNEPGIGSIYALEIKNCFGGINAEIDF
ncbi:MAG: PTS sugar transporter subunit IIA [Spirochaetes bacterium]|nr:PTS sugar transporter subunit IIA [Spirochaetota bacterium]